MWEAFNWAKCMLSNAGTGSGLPVSPFPLSSFPWVRRGRGRRRSRAALRSTQVCKKARSRFLAIALGSRSHSLHPSLTLMFLSWFPTDSVWGIYTQWPRRRACPGWHPAGQRHPTGVLHGYVQQLLGGWGWRGQTALESLSSWAAAASLPMAPGSQLGFC